MDHLTFVKSDHCPILLANELASGGVRASLKPFRYECMWERDHRFSEFLEQTWMFTPYATNVSELTTKLASAATVMSTWGRKTFGSFRDELRCLCRTIEELRVVPSRTGPTKEE